MDSMDSMTPDELTLHNRSSEAANEVLATMGESLPAELVPMVRAGLAIAWIEGRQSGGEEAREVIATFLAELRSTLDAE